MVQEYKNVAIIGAGASGCMCAYFLIKSGIDVSIFDYALPLRTLLPTGGGRCNLAHADYDYKELASNYPRGEKFLYSIFSRFGTKHTIELFEELGIKVYTQKDGRIFPDSNSSKDVRNKILDKIKSADFIKENVEEIIPLESGFKVKSSKSEYLFTDVVVAIGGGKTIKGIEKHPIVPFTPSLVGLNSDIKTLSGVVLKNVYSYDIKEYGDILFTHFGLSGPLIYKISSIKTKEKFPYDLRFNLIAEEINLQEIFDKNPHKELKNILSTFFPHRFAEFISETYANLEACKVDKNIRNKIMNKINDFQVIVNSVNKGEETVTSGGYDLNYINSKTMESKIYPHLYFIGETLDIDGFCGGYNLQNAWSTAYMSACSIMNHIN